MRYRVYGYESFIQATNDPQIARQIALESSFYGLVFVVDTYRETVKTFRNGQEGK